MKQHRALTIIGVLAVAALLVSHSVEVLFFGGPTPVSSQLLARALALLVLGLSQAAFLLLLVVVARRLLAPRSASVKLSFVAATAFLGTLLAPFVAVAFVVGIRSVCFTSSLCTSEVVQYVPHALYVAAGYPSLQVFLASVALLFAVLGLATLGHASPRARPAVAQ